MPRENLEARAWFEKREKEEQELGDKLRKRIADQLRKASYGRKLRPFQRGDRVWMKRPKGVAGPGLQPVWLGPYVISKQVGEHSFEILVGRDVVAVHGSQLKVCVEVNEGDELWECGAVVRSASGGSVPLLIGSVEARSGSQDQENVGMFSPRGASAAALAAAAVEASAAAVGAPAVGTAVATLAATGDAAPSE